MEVLFRDEDLEPWPSDAKTDAKADAAEEKTAKPAKAAATPQPKPKVSETKSVPENPVLDFGFELEAPLWQSGPVSGVSPVPAVGAGAEVPSEASTSSPIPDWRTSARAACPFRPTAADEAPEPGRDDFGEASEAHPSKRPAKSPVKGLVKSPRTGATAKKSASRTSETIEEVREDGYVRVVDRDTCKDPELLRERCGRGRSRRRTEDETEAVESDDGTTRSSERAKRSKSAKRMLPRPSLMARAVAALARRDYSRRELERKLARTLEDDETPEKLAAVLDELEKRGYLSDERFAKGRARVQSASLGNARIRQDLRRSGVSDELAREAVEEIELPEEVRALRVWKKRFSELPKDYKERERQIRYLAYRGFGMGAIGHVLRGRVEDPEDPEGGFGDGF